MSSDRAPAWLGRALPGALAALAACSPEAPPDPPRLAEAAAPLLWTQEPPGPLLAGSAQSAYLGDAVALGADVALVGAPGEQGGRVHVFARAGGSWDEQPALAPADDPSTGYFGHGLAISGDTAIIGAPYKDNLRGAAYVFVRSGGAFSQTHKLTASDGADNDRFGVRIALDGDTAIIITPYKDGNTGAAYVSVRSGGSWSPPERLTAADSVAGDRFGSAVALDGDTAIIGAPYKDNLRGAAYVFVRSGGAWSQQQKLTASDGAVNDNFGGSVALLGDTALVGAPGRVSGKGAVYVFVRSGGAWSQQQILTPAGSGPGSWFGGAVTARGNTAVIGAHDALFGAGAAEVFHSEGGAWYEQQTLSAAGTLNLGVSVAISDDERAILVGDPLYMGNMGAAFAFASKGWNGDPCADASACASGHCADGVCCDTACDAGPCDACSIAAGAPSDGTCAPLDGAACDDGDPCTVADACDDRACRGLANECKAPDPCHGDGACNPGTGECTYPEQPCDTPPSGGAAPPPASDQLHPCSADADCQGRPGQPVCSAEGVCCDARCADPCHSCRVPGSQGACVAEESVDLKHDCSPPGYCLKTCSGGACVDINGPVQCAPVACVAETRVASAAFCPEDGGELCPGAERAVYPCDPYACDPVRGGCLQQCASVNDCAPPFVCDPSHHCVPAPGLSAGADPACAFTPASPARAAHRAHAALAVLFLVAFLAGRRARRRSAGPPSRQRAAPWLLPGALALLAACGADPPPSPPPVADTPAPLVWAEEQTLLTGAQDDRAGQAIAIDGDTAIVGVFGAEATQGRARVFIRVSGAWIEQATLAAGDAAPADLFGTSVALSGDTALVGAHSKDEARGAAYVFVRAGGAWSQQAKLTAPSGGALNDHFGYAVALSGDTALVGAHGTSASQGAAHIFVRSGATWSPQQTLTAAATHFGLAVALRGDTALVGAPVTSNQGAAHVFVRSGATWSHQQTLTASDASAGARFGNAVTLLDGAALVGSIGWQSNRGAVYAFDPATWAEQQILFLPEGAPSRGFGTSLAASGDTAVVGAPFSGSTGGTAHVLRRGGAGSWIEQQTLSAAGLTPGSRFGAAVAVSADGRAVLVGAPLAGANQGAAYAFAELLELGDPCAAAAQCASGHCADGVCCDKACDAGPCDACSIAAGAAQDGACAPVAATSPCDDGDPCTFADACDSGACRGLVNECVAPDACHDDGACDPATGACSYPEKPCDSPPPAGAPPPPASDQLHGCATDADCQGRPGQPVCSAEGVCCDAACADPCHSCRVPGFEGACVAEEAMDLKCDCSPRGYCFKTCHLGECAEINGQVQCAPVECITATRVAEAAFCPPDGDLCPGAERAVYPCEPYTCDPVRGGCLRACESIDDCAPPFVCGPDHHCVPAPGLQVGEDRACAFAPPAPRSASPTAALAALAALARLAARRRPRRA